MLPCSHSRVYPRVRSDALSSAPAGFLSSNGKGGTVAVQRDTRAVPTSLPDLLCDVLATAHLVCKDLSLYIHHSAWHMPGFRTCSFCTGRPRTLQLILPSPAQGSLKLPSHLDGRQSNSPEREEDPRVEKEKGSQGC